MAQPREEHGQNRQIAEMLDSFGDGFIAFDRDWRIVHCNHAGAAHYSLSRDEVLGQVAWSASGLSDDAALKSFLERARAGGISIEAEVQSDLQAGRWFLLRAFPLETGMGLSSRDVTERHEQQHQAREQAARLELALATAGLGYWQWDPVTDLIDLSPRAAQIVGMPPGQRLTWAEQLLDLHPDDRERADAELSQALANRTVYQLECRFTRRSDGEERWIMVRARAQYDDGGKPTGMQGVLSDITQQKAEAEAARADRARLAESEQRFRAMADNAPSPVWVTDQSGAMEFANKAFCTLADMPLDAMQGNGWVAILHPDDRAHVAAARAAARANFAPNTWEARFRVKGGEWRWMRTASQSRFDEAGTFQGYVGMAMDVTETRRAEEHQRLLINELNHRVKNTLATIQSLARQTLREGVPVREARERLTERLLALSAAHNVLTRENWEGADLAEIASEAMRTYEEPTGRRVLICGPHARLAPSVALALSMALHELATNAVKYGALSATGGQVHLEWTLKDRIIDLSWRESGGPPVTLPITRGFGSRLFSGLSSELGAPAEIDYAPDGLICRLRAPTA